MGPDGDPGQRVLGASKWRRVLETSGWRRRRTRTGGLRVGGDGLGKETDNQGGWSPRHVPACHWQEIWEEDGARVGIWSRSGRRELRGAQVEREAGAAKREALARRISN